MSQPPAVPRRWLWPAVLAAAVIFVLGYVYLVALRPVAIVAPVTRGRAINAVPGSVEVKAEYVMELKSEVGGRIASSLLEPGKPVTKDEVLVQIDTADVDIEIERIRSEIVAARRRFEIGSTLRAEEDNKREALEELGRLVKAGAAPVANYDKEKRLYEQIVKRRELEEVTLRLEMENKENLLRAKEREKAKMTITAPTDGVISAVSLAAREGDLIGRDNMIATLISSNRAVEAKISEENFAELKPGLKASVRFLGYGDQQYTATISKVLPTADPTTQRYIVHLEVALAREKLVPGLTGEVSIVLGQRDANAIIPRRALRGNQVFAVVGGVVEAREVKVGYVLSHAEILSGLKEGEEVIVEELDRFSPGMRVRTQRLK